MSSIAFFKVLVFSLPFFFFLLFLFWIECFVFVFFSFVGFFFSPLGQTRVLSFVAAMSESAPLIGTKEQPIGPKTSDYVKVIVWPLVLALCFIGLFVFVMVVPPTTTINFYSVAALATMLLPVIPVLSALVFAKTSVCDSFEVFFCRWTRCAVQKRKGSWCASQWNSQHAHARPEASRQPHSDRFCVCL